MGAFSVEKPTQAQSHSTEQPSRKMRKSVLLSAISILLSHLALSSCKIAGIDQIYRNEMPQTERNVASSVADLLLNQFDRDVILSVNCGDKSSANGQNQRAIVNEILSSVYKRHLSGVTIVNSINSIDALVFARANIFFVDGVDNVRWEWVNWKR